MQGSEYQNLAMHAAGPTLNVDKENGLVIAALGLAGEGGEFCDHIKKVIAQGHELNRDQLIEELGDVLWYVARACEALSITIDDVQLANIAKLQARYPDGFTTERSIDR